MIIDTCINGTLLFLAVYLMMAIASHVIRYQPPTRAGKEIDAGEPQVDEGLGDEPALTTAPLRMSKQPVNVVTVSVESVKIEPTIRQLKAEAKEKKIPGYGRMRKGELLKVLGY